MSKDIITNNRQLDKGNNEMDRQLSINFEENTWYFTKVQNEVLLDEDLSTVNKMVYVALSKFAGERNTCYPSKAKISKIASCGKTAVYNSIRTLEEKGYIVKQERKEKTEEGKIRNKSNLYKIKDLKYLSKFRKYAEDNNDQELLDILSLEPIPTFDELLNYFQKHKGSSRGEWGVVHEVNGGSSRGECELELKNKRERERDFTGKKSQNPSVKEDDYSPTEKKVINLFKDRAKQDITITQANSLINASADIKDKYSLDISHFELIKGALDKSLSTKGVGSYFHHSRTILLEDWFVNGIPNYLTADKTNNSNSKSKSNSNNNKDDDLSKYDKDHLEKLRNYDWTKQ